MITLANGDTGHHRFFFSSFTLERLTSGGGRGLRIIDERIAQRIQQQIKQYIGIKNRIYMHIIQAWAFHRVELLQNVEVFYIFKLKS